MLQEFSGYVLIAFVTIAAMFMLVLDIIKKSYQINQAHRVINTGFQETVPSAEQKLVYPYYVDYSSSIVRFRSE